VSSPSSDKRRACLALTTIDEIAGNLTFILGLEALFNSIEVSYQKMGKKLSVIDASAMLITIII
jgi:hypothetical protein